MADNPWYSFYIGDYDRKTSHLTMLEHGAYRLLLDHYYAMRKPLPNDIKTIYRICRAFTPKERQSVLKILSEFFTNDGLQYNNKRCDSEIDKLLKYSNRQSAAAKLRHSHGTATAQPRARVPQPQPDKEKEKIEKKKSTKHIQLEELKIEMVEAWAKENIKAPIDIKHELLRCQNYTWTKKPINGIATFKSWLLRAEKYYFESHKEKIPNKNITILLPGSAK